MNRRNFLRGCLAVTALAIVQVPDLHAYPILYGDGVHDDTEALQALLDLKPYVCEGKLIEGQTRAVINGGVFKTSATLKIRNDNTSILRASFNPRNFDGPALEVSGVSNCVLCNISIICENFEGFSIEVIKES